jgi:hypothetical protein
MTVRALPAVLATAALLAAAPPASANGTVAQWDEMAQKTVVGAGAFQNEGLIYMAYVSAAVYDAAVAVEGGYRPYGSRVHAPRGASADAAVVEAAYRTLTAHFPSAALDAAYAASLAAIPRGRARDRGIAVGARAAANILALRAGDGRLTPVGTSSPLPFAPPLAAGVWRPTPPAFAAPQTPWVGSVRPFLLRRPDQFPTPAPPRLSGRRWAEAFNEIKAYGSATSTVRSAAQTDIARFWSTNVIVQYNQAVRDIAAARGLGVVETARLMAMVNLVGADAQIAVMNAKYRHMFWRPVTAIDPTAIMPGDPVPGFDDGNPATVEQPGWRPLLVTPNHPEEPAAHGSLTAAMAEVFSRFLGTRRIDLTLTSTVVPAMPTRHFEHARDLTHEIVEARLWGGLHYRFSSEAGVELGSDVARFALARFEGRCDLQ